jgi:hypothetical protein
MRHRLRCRHLRAGQRHGQNCLAFAPTLSSRGVHEAPGPAALIAPACVTLRLLTSHRRTARGAIDLAPVTAAAHQRRRAAACAQEASRRFVAHEHPGELPRVCWTGSSTGATLAPHPLSHDTVKGTANGSNCQVGAAAVPAYLGVDRLQRHDRMRRRWPPARRAPRACRQTPLHRTRHCADSDSGCGLPRAWPPCRAARHARLRDPQSPNTRTAPSQPENSAS